MGLTPSVEAVVNKIYPGNLSYAVGAALAAKWLPDKIIAAKAAPTAYLSG